jgi:hypothetical protein
MKKIMIFFKIKNKIIFKNNEIYFIKFKLKLKMRSMFLDDSRIKELDKRLTMVTNKNFSLISININ